MVDETLIANIVADEVTGKGVVDVPYGGLDTLAQPTTLLAISKLDGLVLVGAGEIIGSPAVLRYRAGTRLTAAARDISSQLPLPLLGWAFQSVVRRCSPTWRRASFPFRAMWPKPVHARCHSPGAGRAVLALLLNRTRTIVY